MNNKLVFFNSVWVFCDADCGQIYCKRIWLGSVIRSFNVMMTQITHKLDFKLLSPELVPKMHVTRMGCHTLLHEVLIMKYHGHNIFVIFAYDLVLYSRTKQTTMKGQSEIAYLPKFADLNKKLKLEFLITSPICYILSC